MIVRTWGGSVPAEQADGFHQHLLGTGVADYRRQAGCLDVQLWRLDETDRVRFLLVSWWLDELAIRSYAGPTPEVAVLYAGDAQFGLEPDKTVTHYKLDSVEISDLAADTQDAETPQPADKTTHVGAADGLMTSPHYSQVVHVIGGRTAYVSGQVPYDADGHLVGKGDFHSQAEQVMNNIRAALAAVQMDLRDVVKVTSYLSEMSNLDSYRKTRLDWFAGDSKPASTTIQAASIDSEILLEVDIIAVSHSHVPGVTDPAHQGAATV